MNFHKLTGHSLNVVVNFQYWQWFSCTDKSNTLNFWSTYFIPKFLFFIELLYRHTIRNVVMMY